MTKTHIELERVSMAYGEKRIFSGLSLSFSGPGKYALLGPSGRGKTTLLRLIAGLETPQSGAVRISSDARIGLCFQEDRLLPWKTVRENVALVCGSARTAQAYSSFRREAPVREELRPICRETAAFSVRHAAISPACAWKSAACRSVSRQA